MIEITPTQRFLDAVDEWADAQIAEYEEALATKAEQALLEIEHLVAGAHDVEFDVDGDTVRYEPSEEVREFLEAQAAAADVDVQTVTTLYVNLYANAFLDDDTSRPPNAPPTE